MSPEEHREYLVEWFSEKFREKYDNGQKEHGGTLYGHGIEWLLDANCQEALDHISYLGTIDYKVSKLKSEVVHCVDICHSSFEPDDEKLMRIEMKLKKILDLVG